MILYLSFFTIYDLFLALWHPIIAEEICIAFSVVNSINTKY